MREVDLFSGKSADKKNEVGNKGVGDIKDCDYYILF